MTPPSLGGKGADPEVRLVALRRLAREFAKRGNPEVLFEVFTQGFVDAERPEAEAQMLLEVLLAGGPADKVKAQAENLKAAVAAGGGEAPISAPALFQKAGVPADGVKLIPPARPDLPAALAHVTALAVQGDLPAALTRVRSVQSAGEKVQLLAAVAHVAVDPKPALDEAAGVVREKGKEMSRPQAVALWRLARAAADAGQPENADLFAKAIPDDGLREWAAAEALGAKWKAAKAAAPAADAPKPESAAKARVGNAWGCLLFARHNAVQTGDRTAAAGYEGWGKGELRGFGYAGLALGLQDRK